MTGFARMRPNMSSMFLQWRSGLLLSVLTLSACSSDWLPHVDLAPPYQPPQYVVPISWHGESPFVEAKPSDAELRPDWWTVYNDSFLNMLEEQAMAANPDLQAAAERFVQARDVMMQVRSQRIPQIGLGGKATDSRKHIDTLARDPDNGARRGRCGNRVLGARFLVLHPQRDARGDLPRRRAGRRLGPRSPQPAGRTCGELFHAAGL